MGILGSSCAFAFGKKPAPYTRPAKEICILGDSGCVCFDPRLAVPPQGSLPISCGVVEKDLGIEAEGVCYVRTYGQCLNYIATNPLDHNAEDEWISKTCRGPKQ